MASLLSQTDESSTNIFLLTDVYKKASISSYDNIIIQINNFKPSPSPDLTQSDYLIILIRFGRTLIKQKKFLKTFIPLLQQSKINNIPVFLLVPHILDLKGQKFLGTLKDFSSKYKTNLRIKIYKEIRDKFSLDIPLNQFFPQIPWIKLLYPQIITSIQKHRPKWVIFPAIAFSLPGLFLYWIFFLNTLSLLSTYCQLNFLNKHKLSLVQVCNQTAQATLSLSSFIPRLYFSLPINNLALNFNRQITAVNETILESLTLLQPIEANQSLFTTVSPDSSMFSLISYQKNLFDNLTKSQPDLSRFLSGNPRTLLMGIMDSHEINPSLGIPLSLVIINLRENLPPEFKVLTPSSVESQSHGDQLSPQVLSWITKSDYYSVYSVSWDPDPSVTATLLNKFLKDELNGVPDAVVFIDKSVISALLRITGPVSLTGQDLVINENSFENNLIASYSSGRDYSEKFVFSLLDSLIPKITSFSESQYQALVQKLYDLADSRKLSVVFPRDPILSVDELGWTNKVAFPSCQSPLPCLVDYLYISELTLRGSKTDRFLSRSFDLQSTIDARRLSSDYLLEYKNNYPASFPYGTDNKYLRIFLQLDIILENLIINNIIKSLDSYSRVVVRDMSVIGFFMSTPPSGETQIRILFHRNISSPQLFHYQMDLPISPGTSPSVSHAIKFPPLWQAIVGGSPSVASPSFIRYNTQVNKSLDININFNQADL